MRYFQEAADRFSDTSWQIHRQWQTDMKKALPMPADKPKPEKNGDAKKIAKCRNGQVNGNIEKPRREITKIEIETVTTNYETLPERIDVDVQLVRSRHRLNARVLTSASVVFVMFTNK